VLLEREWRGKIPEGRVQKRPTSGYHSEDGRP
jgi:hypothetical protein